MQNEKKKNPFAGKGYYIALVLCVAAVGISGYVFVRTARNSAVEANAPAVISPAVSDRAEEKTKDPKQSAASSPSASPEATAKTDDMEDAYEETMGDAAISSAKQWPLEGEVLGSFSKDTLTYSETMADWRTHEGLDIAADQGAQVCAADAGTVTAVYEDDFLGSVVVVSHKGDISTLYANLTETPSVAVGDTVTAGQALGQVGKTALLETSEPDHLHFEVFSGGNAIDPLEYLPDA